MRQFSSPKILVLNKLDLVEQKEYQISLFQRLGQTQIYPFSAQNTANLEKMMEKIIIEMKKIILEDKEKIKTKKYNGFKEKTNC